VRNIGKTPQDIGTDNDFLNTTPNGSRNIARIEKRDYTELKRFCTAKETITRVKRQPSK
jgi:hypothetical protein